MPRAVDARNEKAAQQANVNEIEPELDSDLGSEHTPPPLDSEAQQLLNDKVIEQNQAPVLEEPAIEGSTSE